MTNKSMLVGLIAGGLGACAVVVAAIRLHASVCSSDVCKGAMNRSAQLIDSALPAGLECCGSPDRASHLYLVGYMRGYQDAVNSRQITSTGE